MRIKEGFKSNLERARDTQQKDEMQIYKLGNEVSEIIEEQGNTQKEIRMLKKAIQRENYNQRSRKSKKEIIVKVKNTSARDIKKKNCSKNTWLSYGNHSCI